MLSWFFFKLYFLILGRNQCSWKVPEKLYGVLHIMPCLKLGYFLSLSPKSISVGRKLTWLCKAFSDWDLCYSADNTYAEFWRQRDWKWVCTQSNSIPQCSQCPIFLIASGRTAVTTCHYITVVVNHGGIWVFWMRHTKFQRLLDEVPNSGSCRPLY